MRRMPPTPTIDMTSMMGLCAVLIAMILMAYTPPLATIDTNLPGL